MRTLYVRIVVIFIAITFVSGLFALFFSNMYYLDKLKDHNEKKVLIIGEEIRDLYETAFYLDLDDYLTRIANMGFQIFVVNNALEESFYGDPFKHIQFDLEHIQHVLAGEIYYGMMEERQFLKVTNFFENSIRNSVGLPIEIEGQVYALFIRPNLEQQIGEVRILLAILIGFSFLFSLVLIVILTRFIVKPIRKLMIATDSIVGGNYNIELEVARKDEIGDLARHFTQMAHALERLDAMRQEFVANVSHEIQSPLTTMQGFAQAILDKEVTPDDAEHYLQIIAEESSRLSSLSKQLLTLATLDKEMEVVKKSSFRLDEQIRQILIKLEWQWTEKQLLMEPILPEVIIHGDVQLLHQVWLNLITNSIKFSRPGDTIRIEITIEQHIVVKISDTGTGISEKELPHVFERFYKADEARGRSQGGSGLGLAIVKKVVELHGGNVDAESKIGQGSTFIVRLSHH